MTVQYVFLAGVASLLTIWIIIYYDQIGKLYQFVYLYADKLNCVVKTEKRFILHENLKNPAHLNEISLLFNHHSDVHKQRSRNVDIFCIFPRCFTFNIFIKNKRQCIGRSDDRSRRGVTLKKLWMLWKTLWWLLVPQFFVQFIIRLGPNELNWIFPTRTFF